MLSAKNYLGPFEGFKTVLQEEFYKYGTVIEFSKNSNPFDPDNMLNWFFIIISGKVKIFDINFETNREQTLYLLVRGDMYDVVTLLDNNLHNLASEVIEKGEAIRFPIDKVREWMKKYPTFEQLIYKYIAKQVRSVESLAIDLSLYSTKERLLKLLLRNKESIENRGIDLLSKLSHSEIASLIGTVRHIIDRHIKELKKEDVLDREQKRVTLKNAQKVLEMLESY